MTNLMARVYIVFLCTANVNCSVRDFFLRWIKMFTGAERCLILFDVGNDLTI